MDVALPTNVSRTDTSDCLGCDVLSLSHMTVIIGQASYFPTSYYPASAYVALSSSPRRAARSDGRRTSGNGYEFLKHFFLHLALLLLRQRSRATWPTECQGRERWSTTRGRRCLLRRRLPRKSARVIFRFPHRRGGRFVETCLSPSICRASIAAARSHLLELRLLAPAARVPPSPCQLLIGMSRTLRNVYMHERGTLPAPAGE